MKKILPCSNYECCMVAVYKKRWVYVPVFYIPHGLIAENLDRMYPHSLQTMLLKYPFIKETILPDRIPKRDLNRICEVYHIPLPWVTGQCRRNFVRGKNRRSQLDNNFPIDKPTFTIFLRQLKKVSKKSSVIAELLWHLNKNIPKLCPGLFVTLEDILRLRITDIPERLQEHEPPLILIQLSLQPVGHTIPKPLWRKLVRQIQRNANSPFLFPSKYGTPIFPTQIEKHFHTACEKAGIKRIISPLSFRFISSTKKTIQRHRTKKIKATNDQNFKEVSPKKWNHLCKVIPYLINKEGRKSKHNPRVLLNAILYHLRSKTPLRSLPKSFPHWQAVHSQYRRWQKKGLISKILKFLEPLQSPS